MSSATSFVTPTTFITSLTKSVNLLFGLPLSLLPGSSNLNIILLTYTASGHVQTISVWPLRLYLQIIFLSSDGLIPDPHSCASPDPSLHVTPKGNLNIFISATSSSPSSLLLMLLSLNRTTHEFCPALIDLHSSALQDRQTSRTDIKLSRFSLQTSGAMESKCSLIFQSVHHHSNNKRLRSEL